MRKLSEIQNEEALDVIADILDPVIEICQDDELKEVMTKNDRMAAIKIAIKKHKEAIMLILATLDGESIETYKINLIQIPTKLLELFNDPDMAAFFQSQGLMISDAFSGSATVTTEETGIE